MHQGLFSWPCSNEGSPATRLHQNFTSPCKGGCWGTQSLSYHSESKGKYSLVWSFHPCCSKWTKHLYNIISEIPVHFPLRNGSTVTFLPLPAPRELGCSLSVPATNSRRGQNDPERALKYNPYRAGIWQPQGRVCPLLCALIPAMQAHLLSEGDTGTYWKTKSCFMSRLNVTGRKASILKYEKPGLEQGWKSLAEFTAELEGKHNNWHLNLR